MYTINAEYKCIEDTENKIEATTRGISIFELYHDIEFFIKKNEYYCSKCKKNHRIKIKSITINFNSK